MSRSCPGGRNAQRMPAIQSLDMSLQKVFNLGRSDVALVAEAFNLTNHENVTGVTTSVRGSRQPDRLRHIEGFSVRGESRLLAPER